MSNQPNLLPRKIFRRPDSWVGEVLRRETVGGALLLAATAIALVWSNSSAAAGYTAVRDHAFGIAAWHLELSASDWAADGLLAVFFFVAGLELKREFVVGELRDPRRAAIPVVAAVAGVAVPALLFTLINLGGPGRGGWAIPTATDIAFALAVLAVIGRRLPTALRTFLLTLAVVDDLIAITIIAVFYTSSLALVPLLLMLLPLAAFAVLVQRGVRAWYVLLPLAALTWVLTHASGVHATVAGVLLAFTVPVARPGSRAPDLAGSFEHRVRPWSSGVAVPIFAFFAAGVTVGGAAGIGTALTDRVTLGIIVGLVAGKVIGVFGATFVLAKFTRADLDEDIGWIDVFGLSLLSGMGFTVSLLIGELAFGVGSEIDARAKVGVLLGSLLAAVLAAIVLGLRSRRVPAARPDAP